MRLTSRRLAPMARITPISPVCSAIIVRMVLASKKAAESTASTVRMSRTLLRWSKTLLNRPVPGSTDSGQVGESRCGPVGGPGSRRTALNSDSAFTSMLPLPSTYMSRARPMGTGPACTVPSQTKAGGWAE